MRNFNDADKKKKSSRIRIQKNLDNLSRESLLELESIVKASLKDGYLSCPVAWRIAKNANVSKIVVGEIADRLGFRITNCQLGCFKVEKAPYDKSAQKSLDEEVITIIEKSMVKDKLTCSQVFELASKYKLKPIAVANEMNARGIKISDCQLGCF